MSEKIDEVRIPIIEEEAIIGRRERESRVIVDSQVEERDELVEEVLRHEDVRLERVPVYRIVEEMPQVRSEPGRIVVPVIEEVLVKRILLKEEIHLIREVREERVSEPVTLRRTQPTVRREDIGQTDPRRTRPV